MRTATAVCLLFFWPCVVLADNSGSPAAVAASCPAVEPFELEVCGFGGVTWAKFPVALESPFRASSQLVPFMTPVFHGVLRRTKGMEYTLDLTIEKFYKDGTTDRGEYRKKLRLDAPEDLAPLVYYGVRLTRSR